MPQVQKSAKHYTEAAEDEIQLLQVRWRIVITNCLVVIN